VSDDDGSLYISGKTYGDFDTQINSGEGDAFLAKFNSEGIIEWSHLLGAESDDNASAITKGIDGAIYIAGGMNGDAFIAKFNRDGSKDWVRPLGLNLGGFAQSITTTGENYIYILGSAKESGIFIAKYDSSGTKLWLQVLPRESTYDYYNALSIATMGDGLIYIAGGVSGDMGDQTSGGETDGFIVQLKDSTHNLAPRHVSLSNTFLQENIAPGSTVATLSTSDPDAGDFHSYALVSGTGATDNSFFSIDGNQLKINASPDFESKSSYSIRLQTTDLGGLTMEKEVTLNVTNIPELLLPRTTLGKKVTIVDTALPSLEVTSQGSPDLIEIKAPVQATLNALTTKTHALGFVARNVGTTTNEGTGQIIPLVGLGKYTFVVTAIPEATTTINLEPAKDTAFFLHDAYSAFYEGLTLTPDSTGRQSHQRVLNVDTIVMGSGGGTSIVDLTSKDYVTGAVTVYGADKGRSIFWGTDANDTFISGGGDSVIFGGGGSNSASLGTGRDTLQYRLGVGAIDQISGFDPFNDVVELWMGKTESAFDPKFSSLNGSTVMTWGGNTLEFLDIADLTLSNLQVISRVA
jgi:hypothetical protein